MSNVVQLFPAPSDLEIQTTENAYQLQGISTVMANGDESQAVTQLAVAFVEAAHRHGMSFEQVVASLTEMWAIQH